ncbi:MAG: YHS domain-containing protein [Terriglobales bacterium]
MSETEKGNVGVSAAIDPVCGMTVEKAGARAKARHAGRDYFFCSAGCLTKFTADPSAVLAGGPKAKGSGLVSIGMPVAAKASATKAAAGATNAASGAASGRDARQDSRV